MGDTQDQKIAAAKAAEKAGDTQLGVLKKSTQDTKAAYAKWRDAIENRQQSQQGDMMGVQQGVVDKGFKDQKDAENAFKPLNTAHLKAIADMKKGSKDLGVHIEGLKTFQKEKKKRPLAVVTAAKELKELEKYITAATTKKGGWDKQVADSETVAGWPNPPRP